MFNKKFTPTTKEKIFLENDKSFGVKLTTVSAFVYVFYRVLPIKIRRRVVVKLINESMNRLIHNILFN